EFRLDGTTVDPAEIPGVELALRIGMLANRATVRETEEGWRAEGDPTEAALLVAGAKAGM
ncbi:MAG: hypothetical protein GWN99_08130, partial [Gemmatimonadetes bacterium]|nr:hypothetical protein [Gemmatimonadota bacterium]NIS01025.1 hypothetical protein [Gemmatimonadota bacterium]NIT66655.1 hypothetical protein [Gemmatimonadota bacterium]NIU53582.1 hypothetical protein [Gemmatimonadota bacterium]NIV23175.1 hypothetical protein [Gemmatimonadota bacterium]